MLWRHHEALLQFLCRYILLQNYRFNADNRFGVDVTIVVLVSWTNINQ